MRLDVHLVEKGYFETRSKAKSAIEGGCVKVCGKVAKKPAFNVVSEEVVEIVNPLKYVSKGGLKLEKAINEFCVCMKGAVVLDIGSSTGGFTDCAIQNGAQKVFAVDVGVNQLHASLRVNPKVVSLEDTDIREIDKDLFGEVNIASMDVSFISVTKIIPYIYNLPNLSEVICLIKPQFECGKDIAKKCKGIIRSKTIHKNVISSVVDAFSKCGFNLSNLTFSPIQGGDGNIEYLALFAKKPCVNIDYDKVVNLAFSNFQLK